MKGGGGRADEGRREEGRGGARKVWPGEQIGLGGRSGVRLFSGLPSRTLSKWVATDKQQKLSFVPLLQLIIFGPGADAEREMDAAGRGNPEEGVKK